MKYLDSYKIFERKGNYQLFHKTNKLEEIIKSGYIIAGGKDNYTEFWNYGLRRSVISNWEKDNPKFKTISATRNFDYFDLPALELDVEKISDKYKIIPFSENPDYYLDFSDNKLKPNKNSNLNDFQQKIRSKSKNAGKEWWRVKTDKGAFDFGISEELILTDKLDVGKYVKRIILGRYSLGDNDKIINLIKDKYPHIEIVEIDSYKYGKYGYADIKKALKQKEKIKEPVFEGIYDYIMKQKYYYEYAPWDNDDTYKLENIGFHKNYSGYPNQIETYIYDTKSTDTIIKIDKRERQLPGPEGFISIYRIEINNKKSKKVKYIKNIYDVIDYVNKYIPEIDQDVKKYNL